MERSVHEKHNNLQLGVLTPPSYIMVPGLLQACMQNIVEAHLANHRDGSWRWDLAASFNEKHEQMCPWATQCKQMSCHSQQQYSIVCAPTESNEKCIKASPCSLLNSSTCSSSRRMGAPICSWNQKPHNQNFTNSALSAALEFDFHQNTFALSATNPPGLQAGSTMGSITKM